MGCEVAIADRLHQPWFLEGEEGLKEFSGGLRAPGSGSWVAEPWIRAGIQYSKGAGVQRGRETSHLYRTLIT